MTLEQFRAEFQLPFTMFYDKHTPHVPLPQLEAWFHGRFRQVQNSVCALPHAREFLEFCRANQLRTFLLSTVHEDHFEVQKRASGFGEFLDKPYVGVWDKREKIHEILKENKLRARRHFHGDMQHDIETARHGGIIVRRAHGLGTAGTTARGATGCHRRHLGELRESTQNELHLKPPVKFEEAQSPWSHRR
jgi:phosphoglycolate phosphatase